MTKMSDPSDLSNFCTAFARTTSTNAERLTLNRIGLVIKLLVDVLPRLAVPHDWGELAKLVIVLTDACPSSKQPRSSSMPWCR